MKKNKSWIGLTTRDGGGNLRDRATGNVGWSADQRNLEKRGKTQKATVPATPEFGNVTTCGLGHIPVCKQKPGSLRVEEDLH